MTVSEVRRIAAVRDAQLLDTSPEAAFDRVTALAADLFDVPIALVTVVDEHRIWFKSRAGLEVEEIDREPGLCSSAITGAPVWVVEDARNDPRTCDNGLVTGDLNLQFYAGAPLRDREGVAIGTLCLIDNAPRRFSENERARLENLAGLVEELIELRRHALQSAARVIHVDDGSAARLQEQLHQRMRAERSQRMLADVTTTLFTATDLTVALDSVAGRTLPLMGQGVAISMVDDEGFRTNHVAALDPAAEAILGKARDASEQVNLDETPAVLEHVMGAGEPLQCTVEEALTWPGMPDAPGLREALDQLGTWLFLFLPLVVQDRTIGFLTFLASEPDWVYDDDDVANATALAARIAVAIDNSRLRDVERQIANALQGSLLPAVLPTIPGVDVAARYRAAGPSDIGGDFYDVFANDASSWTLLLGDVSGKGPEAAAIAGLARYTTRALALTQTQPEAILRHLNTAVERQSKASKYLTALCANLRVSDDGLTVHLADAGHLPALVRRADGKVEIVELNGTALGLFPDANVASTTLHLRPGDVFLVCTDGATDARDRDGEFLQLDGVAGILGGLRLRRAANIANRVLSAVAAFEDGTPTDDLALVVVRVSETGQG